MILVTILALWVAFWVVIIIFRLTLIKRNLLDPRIYVLYGLFHFLIVGQLGTLLGYNFYEVKPLFDEAMHAKAAILIAGSVLAFLIGYSVWPRTLIKKHTLKAHLVPPLMAESLYRIRARRLIYITFFLGIVGQASSFYFQKNVQLILAYSFLPLLLTYLGVVGSVLAVHILILERYKLRGIVGVGVYISLVVFALAGILGSNVMLIFPLFYALYSWYIKKLELGERVRLGNIFKWAGLVVLVGLWSIIYKIAIQGYISTGEIDPASGMTSIVHRWLSLDLFNPEHYGIVMHAMEMYGDSGRLLAGRSLLVAIPFLRLVFEDVRGFGRIIVLDIYGPSYLTKNVGWGVPPIGELVANFWYPMPVIFYFLLGMICRYLYEKLYRSVSPAYRAFYGVLLPWLFIQQRGDFLNGFVFPGYVVFGVVIVFWLSEKRQRPK